MATKLQTQLQIQATKNDDWNKSIIETKQNAKCLHNFRQNAAVLAYRPRQLMQLVSSY